MDSFEKLLRDAKSHNNAAMMELITLFAGRLRRACIDVHLYDDDDLQSFLILRFIERVYEYKIDESLCSHDDKQKINH